MALALLADPARAAPPATEVDPAATVVELESRPVVRFLAPLGHASPAERARQARHRLEALPNDAAGLPVSVKPFQLGEERGHAVLIGDTPILTVVEGDLDPAGNDTTATLAGAAAARLDEALRARHDQRSLPLVLRAIGASAAATAILAFLLWGLAWMRRRAAGAVGAFAESHGGFLARRGLDPRPLIASGSRGLLRLLYWLVAAALLDLWLTYVLRRFPATAPWADAISGRVLGIMGDLGLEVLSSIPGLVGVVIIVTVTRALSSFLSGAFDRVAAGTLTFPGLHPETVGASRRIAQAFLWMAALAAAYPYLPGSSSEAFKGLSLLLGVMVSLGSTGIMAQAMSGLVLVYSRALGVGDSIRAGAVEGVVSEVGLLSTKVITLRGEEVTLPNNVVIAGGVTNFSRLNRGGGALCTTTVTIGYDAPWRQVEALLTRAASGTRGLLAEVPPYVLQRSLSDFFVTYDLVARLENPIDRPQVLSELHGRIQDLFNEAGIQIMSPHFMVQPPAPVLARPTGDGPDRPPRPPPVSG
jgi:small-conductance mechanosensitive channel